MSEEYMVLIREAEWNPDEISAEDWQAAMAGHAAFPEAVQLAGEKILASDALQPVSAATKITPQAGGKPVSSPTVRSARPARSSPASTASRPRARSRPANSRP